MEKKIEALLKKAVALNEAKEYQEVIELLPDEVLEKYGSADLWAELAQAYWRLNRFEECNLMADRALGIDHSNVKGHHYKGNFYQEIKEYDKAIEHYQGAIKLDLNFVSSYNGLGNVYYNQKKYEKAKEFFEKAIELDPNFALAYNGLGNAYYNQKKYEKAKEFFEKAIEFDPNFALAYNNLGIIYYNQKKYEKAIELYEKALELDSNYASAYNNLGIVYYDQNNFERAIACYQKAMAADSNYARSYNGLGNVYYIQENYEMAIECYRQAIVLDPKSTYPYYNIGLVFKSRDNYEEAIENFIKAIELDSDYASPLYSLGLAYFEQKKYLEAKEYFQKYISKTEDKDDIFVGYAKSKIEEIDKLLEQNSFQEISEIVQDIKALLLFTDGNITHYTSLSTSKALLLNNESNFRISEGTYLNDTSEGKELFKYLEFNSFESYQTSNLPIIFTEKPFIGSFVVSTKHDDLALWRMYGKENMEEAKGCALTIDAVQFIQAIRDKLTGVGDSKKEKSSTSDMNWSDEFSFYRVAYLKYGARKISFTIPGGKGKDEKTLNKLMNKLQGKIKEYLKKLKNPDDETKDIIEALNEIAYLFKSAEYQYEQELRLVIKEAIGFEKKVEEINELPKTYIELVNIRPLIKKITLGPKVARADEWAAAFHYDLKNDNHNPEIFISQLPFK